MSLTTITELISERQSQLGLTDDQIAAALGYADGAVIRMIKKGTMKLPINRAEELAAVLQMERWPVVEAALSHAPELLKVMRTMSPVGYLSDAEANTIREIRIAAQGRQPAPIVFAGPVIALVSVA